MTTSQLTLDIGQEPLYRWENLFVSSCNESAIAYIKAWPRWSHPMLVLYGPQQCGKRHLAHLWAAEVDAQFIDAETLCCDDLSAEIARHPRVVMEWNVITAVREQAVLHCYNLVHEYEGFMLFTAPTSPASWGIQLKDLASRMNTVPAIEIQQPDDDMLKALYIKAFSDRQLRIGEDVIAYLTKRSERTYAGVAHLVQLIDAVALSEGRNITLPLARRVVEHAVSR